MSRHLRSCAVLLAIAVPLALAACGDSDSTSSNPSTATTATTAAGPRLGPAFGSMDDLAGVLKTPPPWPANAGKLQLRLRAIGLPALTAEGQVVHIHQHLDLFVDGRPVAVASDIGIAADRSFISPLHTHEPQPGDPPDGIMHVESPTETNFTLGQFFAVWGVRLDAKCLGGKCAAGDTRLRAWVNGEPLEGDPTRVVLAEHQEIVLAYGTAAQMPKRVPATYDFAAVGL
jgi:hypothetical protein